MGGSGGIFGGINQALGAQGLYDSVVKKQGNFGDALTNSYPGVGLYKAISGNAPSPDNVPAPGATPTPQNSQGPMDEAAAAQRKAKGAKATIFGGMDAGLLSSGSSSSQRLLLGT